MKVVIVDDELSNREILKIMLANYFPDIHIVGEAEQVDHFFESISGRTAFDLLFLDILMPDKTGFDLLNKLQFQPFELIFVSGFEEFAIEAFKYTAIDYILKPIDKDRFIQAVEKVQSRIREKELLKQLTQKTGPETKIQVIKNQKTVYIDLADVAYLIGESGGYTTIYCCNGEEHLVSKSLKALEEDELKSVPYLMKVNKSTIINLNDIASCDRGGSGYLTLKTNQLELFLPRRKKREVLQEIDQYFQSKKPF